MTENSQRKKGIRMYTHGHTYSGTSLIQKKVWDQSEGVQISEMFGIVKRIMVLMKHFVVSN